MPRKMPPLKKAEFLVVDVETTGLATDSDLILQIGAVVTNAKGTVLRSYSTYVRPSNGGSFPWGVENPPAHHIHGITNEQLRQGLHTKRAMRQLHDLGFAVEEVAITIDGDTQMISFQPKLVAAGYHSQRLRDLTGLETEELQAKRLLASFDRYNARENKLGLSINEMAKKWIAEVFEPVISRVPDDMRGRVERAQMFHEILENRWYLSEKAGYDVGLEEATDNYCAEILPMRRDSGVDIVVQ